MLARWCARGALVRARRSRWLLRRAEVAAGIGRTPEKLERKRALARRPRRRPSRGGIVRAGGTARRHALVACRGRFCARAAAARPQERVCVYRARPRVSVPVRAGALQRGRSTPPELAAQRGARAAARQASPPGGRQTWTSTSYTRCWCGFCRCRGAGPRDGPTRRTTRSGRPNGPKSRPEKRRQHVLHRLRV